MIDTIGFAGACAYLSSLLVIGALARRARREETLSDYYLAGSSLGLVSLFFTLYATQYSGNTLFGVPGQAYREGFPALAVTFAVMGIVGVYMLFAPALNTLAREKRFVTPADFLHHRFAHRGLTLLANAIFVFTLIGYVLANFKAIGLLVEGASGGQIPSAAGIMALALVMAIYESLGGMRSVVWTDILQGSILLIGSLVVFSVVAFDPALGILSADEFASEIEATFAAPRPALEFFSLMLLVGVGAAVYPQAIQRIYAARDATTLKRSYGFLVVMPLLVMAPLSIVAMSAVGWLPALPVVETERVIVHVIDAAIGDTIVRSLTVALFLGAALAAIMSTVDSALLSLGAILTKDVLSATLVADDEQSLHRVGRRLTWLLMAAMAVLAIVLPQSIWALMVLKFELLIQVAPAFVLGVRRPGTPASALVAGIFAGCTVAIALRLIPGLDAPLGIHAGAWGFAANLGTIAALSAIRRTPSARHRQAPDASPASRLQQHDR